MGGYIIFSMGGCFVVGTLGCSVVVGTKNKNMECPEIFNFKAPKSILHVEKLEEKNFTSKIVTDFYNNHLVSVVIPDALKIPDELTNSLVEDCEYYKVIGFNISEVVDEKFICCFIANGNLTLLSVDSRIDCDNCFALTPHGKLILSLDRHTYLTLGIEGTVSHYLKKLKSRYIVTMDLKNGKLNLPKLKSKLSNLDQVTVILSWNSPEENICPSSIAKYFADMNYRVKLCTPKFVSHTVYTAEVPKLNLEVVDQNDISDFLEWLGMVSLDADLETKDSNNYINSYVTPEPKVELGQVKCLQWKGLFTTFQIQKLLEKLVKYNEIENKCWVSMYVQGFADSPVSWNYEENHYSTGGENCYIAIFNKVCQLLCVQKCPRKRYK